MFILPPDSVLHALALPPTDPRFPSLALLHALCALGASMVPIPPHADNYWRDAPTPSAYHFRQAKLHINTFKFSNVLDDARAALLLTVYSFAAEQFMEVWQLVGMACRSLAPAGLNVSIDCNPSLRRLKLTAVFSMYKIIARYRQTRWQCHRATSCASPPS